MIRSWLEVLPEFWRDNPEVVVIRAPRTSRLGTIETTDGYRLTVIEINGTKRGVQVVLPDRITTYPDHAEIFARHGYEMEWPAYVGPLHDAPDDLFISDDFTPLVFACGEMCRPYFFPLAYFNHLGHGGRNN